MKGMTDQQYIISALGELSPEALRYFFPGLSLDDADMEGGIRHMCRGNVNDAARGSGRRRLPRLKQSMGTYLPMHEEECPMELCELEPSFGMPCMPGCYDADDLPGDIAEDLIRELELLQQKYSVTIEQIEAVLSYKVRLSHMRITGKHDIILEDFDYLHVKMDTLTKAVYLLFLKHPEGIRFKELSDHTSELEQIYMSITGRTDMESIRRSITSLTDPLDNSINEKVSKAKKAFRNVIDDRIAKFYYIDGKQGAAKGIALDRSLVIWE